MAKKTVLKSVPNLETMTKIVEFTKDDLHDLEKLMFFCLALHDLMEGDDKEVAASTIADIIEPVRDRLCNLHDRLKAKFEALEATAAQSRLEAFVKDGIQ